MPDFEDEDELVLQGVTPILRYDPLGRLIRTDLPDGTYSRTVFDAWSQTAFDPNDTVGEADNAWALARGPLTSATDEEKRAALLALAHADTPTTSHVDALGRVFLVEAKLTPTTVVPARTELDIEGQGLAVRDALGTDGAGDPLGRECANSAHSIGGQGLRSVHIDSGEGFALADVAGAPLYAWDALGHRVRTQFDALRRPTHVWVKKGTDPEWLSQRIVYGEAAPSPAAANLRGRVLLHFDGAGLAVTDAYDFKGNLLASSRQLAVTYDAEPDWSALASLADPADVLDAAESLLEAETFAKTVAYDALNRPTSMVQPDSSEVLPSYNEAGLLDGVAVKIRGAATATTFVDNIDYDVKGRREKIEYGNGTATTYDYDPLTYRLTRIKTTRATGSAVLQNLFYTYDPVGNIVAIADTAHEEVFFAGQQVSPSAEYEYDALYRLVRATGREHAGGVGDDPRDHNDLPLWNLPHPNDAQALRNYEEQYEYDLVGNIEKLIHTAVGSSAGSWTRRYAYGSDPFASPPGVPDSNRLRSTSLPGDDPEGPYTATYAHDAAGNMVAMPHLAAIAYTHTHQMREADLGGGGTAYYAYDAAGERVRKVIQRLGTTKEERIYLGGWELYRKRQGASQDIVLERETLHVMDDARRIAMVETKTIDADVEGTLPIVPRTRYQLDNHLGTACLEVDDAGLVISYEEYHPYGTSAYRSARSGVEVSEKRYRYTGKERDEETGFGYHSARYYVPWLGRWTSADPAGMVDGPSLFPYCQARPITLTDPLGSQSVPWPTEEPTEAEEAAQESIQEEHEPLLNWGWKPIEGDGAMEDGHVGNPFDSNNMRPWAVFRPSPLTDEDIYDEIGSLLEFDRQLNQPAALATDSSPPMEEVIVNAAALFAFDPIVLLIAASSPESPSAAEQRQALRPFPYPAGQEPAGEAGEFMFQMAVMLALGTAQATTRVATGLTGALEIETGTEATFGTLRTASGTWGGIDATPAAQRMASLLQAPGDMVELPRGALTLADLGSLASSQEAEFAVIRLNGTRYLLRGYSSGARVPENARLIAHVHPGEGFFGLKPSADDMQFLQRFEQGRSALINESGAWRTYGQTEATWSKHIRGLQQSWQY